MKHGRTPLGVLSILIILLLNLLAASPSLHELLHHDANQPGHQCAVTVFAHGQVDSSVVDVAMPIPAATIEFSPPILVSVPSALAAALPPGRGPPVSLLHS